MPGGNRYELSLIPADVGSRVMVRREVGAEHVDIVGPLLAFDESGITVAAPDGSTVPVPLSALIAGKVVPPAPRWRRHVDPPSLTSDAELERIALLGWRATEAQWVDGWLLRAGGGFTGRSNSALPLDGPGPGLSAVVDWYDERSLRPQLQVPLPLGAELDAQLESAGWEGHNPTWVMTAPVETVAGPEPTVQVDLVPDEDWLASYHYRGGALPAIGRTILRAAQDPGFASIRADGSVVAIARGACDRGWVGLTAIEVAQSHRRQGLATTIVRGIAHWAASRGAKCCYLQVAQSNAGAIALYESLGFVKHHAYVYRVAPPA